MDSGSVILECMDAWGGMVEEGRGLSRRPIANLPREKRQQPGLVPSSENNADATTLEAWTLLLVPNSPAFHEYRQRIDGAGPVLSGRWREKPRHIISHNGHSAPVAQLQYHLLLIEQCTRYTIAGTRLPPADTSAIHHRATAYAHFESEASLSICI